MVEKLKLVLIGVVLLLAAAVVYGYVDDGSESSAPAPTESTESTGTVADAPETTPEPESGEPDGSPPAAKPAGKGDGGKQPQKTAGAGTGQGGPGGSQAGSSGGSSGGSKPAPQSEAPAKSEYIAEVDAICRKLPGRFSTLAEEATRGGAEGPEELEAAIRGAIVRTLTKTAREIDALTPPAGDGEEVAAIVASMEKAIRNIQNKPSLDPINEAPLTEFGKRSKRYGLDRCGQF